MTLEVSIAATMGGVKSDVLCCIGLGESHRVTRRQRNQMMKNMMKIMDNMVNKYSSTMRTSILSRSEEENHENSRLEGKTHSRSSTQQHIYAASQSLNQPSEMTSISKNEYQRDSLVSTFNGRGIDSLRVMVITATPLMII